MKAKNQKAAEVKLIYKNSVAPSSRVQISSSKDVFQLLCDIWDQDTIALRETFFLILMNHANQVLGYFPLSHGGISGTVVDVKLIMQSATLSNASALVLAHNHPSGNMQPSQADLKLTQKIKEAGKLLDVAVLDHLIISPCLTTYFSFAHEGRM